jgi:hypothetical protein
MGTFNFNSKPDYVMSAGDKMALVKVLFNTFISPANFHSIKCRISVGFLKEKLAAPD